MAEKKHGRLGRVVFTVAMIALLSLAVSQKFDMLFYAVFIVLIGGVAGFHMMFPGSRLFAVAFANFILVYACLFAFFTQVNFQPVSEAVQPVGFVLPVIAFLAGAWWRRAFIRAIVASEQVRGPRDLPGSLLWLVPVFAVGGLTFLFPALDFSNLAYDWAFLLSMATIAGIVFFVSGDVTAFLIDTGLLFEEFFERMAAVILPVFAFLTFYSLTIIVFASLYRVLDRFSAVQNFRIGGQLQELDFPNALYFSVITLSTVGYGEITPATPVAQVLVAVQIILGVLLLLFGFSEIITYTRERRRDRER